MLVMHKMWSAILTESESKNTLTFYIQMTDWAHTSSLLALRQRRYRQQNKQMEVYEADGMKNEVWGLSVLVFLLWLQITDHDACKDCHHHLWLHLDNIFWQSIDFGTDLTCHRDCVLCIRKFLLQHIRHQRSSEQRVSPVCQVSTTMTSLNYHVGLGLCRETIQKQLSNCWEGWLFCNNSRNFLWT